MPEFQCTVMICAGQNLIVEAQNEVHAAEKAEEIFEDNHTGLCHQCAKETDLGDCYGVLVASIDGTQILLETDAKSVTIRQQLDQLGARGFEIAELKSELDVLREYRSASINFTNSLGEVGSLESFDRAEARLEAAQKACHEYYRKQPIGDGAKP